MTGKFSGFIKNRFTNLPNSLYSKMILQSKLKKETYKSPNLLKKSNCFLRNQSKSIKTLIQIHSYRPCPGRNKTSYQGRIRYIDLSCPKGS